MKLRLLVAGALAAGFASAQAPQPGPAGVVPFTINNEMKPGSLDPARMSSLAERRLFMALFEGLMVPDPRTGLPSPGLAESWSASADLKTYTYRLRSAAWSDGKPITANDVAASWLRAAAPETPAAGAGDLIGAVAGARDFHDRKGPRDAVGVKAVDSRTFEVRFARPMPDANQLLLEPCFGVVPGPAIAAYREAWTRPEHFVGNGPFLLQAWEPDGTITVVKNARYWDAANVKLDRITFRVGGWGGDAYDAYRQAAFDWTPAIDPLRYPEIKRRKDYQASAGFATYYLALKVDRKPLSDARVRRALALAIDRQALCDRVTGTGEIPAAGFLPAGDDPAPAPGSGFDPEAARRLLAEAGFPGGRGMPKLRVMYNTLGLNERVLEWVAGQWRSILGVTCELQDFDRDFYRSLLKANDFDVARESRTLRGADPVEFLELFHRGNPDNHGQDYGPQLDDLLDRAKRQTDAKVRAGLVREIEERAITREQLVIPIFQIRFQDLIDLDRWGGWYANPSGLHPWKSIYGKPQASAARAAEAPEAAASVSPDAYLRPVPHLFQEDPRILAEEAPSLCVPTSSAMIIDYFAKGRPRLKPRGMTGFDLIRAIMKEEMTGNESGTNEASAEDGMKRYFKKAGYRLEVTSVGIIWGSSRPNFSSPDFARLKSALHDPDQAVMVFVDGCQYHEKSRSYVIQYGHGMVLVGYDPEHWYLADPARRSEVCKYRLRALSHPDAALAMAGEEREYLPLSARNLFELERDPYGYHDIVAGAFIFHVAD